MNAFDKSMVVAAILLFLAIFLFLMSLAGVHLIMVDYNTQEPLPEIEEPAIVEFHKPGVIFRQGDELCTMFLASQTGLNRHLGITCYNPGDRRFTVNAPAKIDPLAEMPLHRLQSDLQREAFKRGMR